MSVTTTRDKRVSRILRYSNSKREFQHLAFALKIVGVDSFFEVSIKNFPTICNKSFSATRTYKAISITFTQYLVPLGVTQLELLLWGHKVIKHCFSA